MVQAPGPEAPPGPRPPPPCMVRSQISGGWQRWFFCVFASCSSLPVFLHFCVVSQPRPANQSRPSQLSQPSQPNPRGWGLTWPTLTYQNMGQHQDRTDPTQTTHIHCTKQTGPIQWFHRIGTGEAAGAEPYMRGPWVMSHEPWAIRREPNRMPRMSR